MPIPQAVAAKPDGYGGSILEFSCGHTQKSNFPPDIAVTICQTPCMQCAAAMAGGSEGE